MTGIECGGNTDDHPTTGMISIHKKEPRNLRSCNVARQYHKRRAVSLRPEPVLLY